MINIRPIDLRHDLPTILDLEEATFGADAFPLSEFLYLYRRGKNLFFVAYEGKTCLGYISAYRENQHAYIASIAVSQGFRRQGIGRQLINKIIKQLEASNTVETLSLHVRQSNTPAIELYKALNFSIIGQEVDYYPDEDAYIMIFHLN